MPFGRETPEEWLDFYLDVLKLSMIPTLGQLQDGKWNPKAPGYKNWETGLNPRTNKSWTRKELLNEFLSGKNWGVLCGEASGNLFVIDIDLQRTTGSVQSARELRKRFIPELRKLGTMVSFTPSGGVHVLFRTLTPDPDKSLVADAIGELTNTDSRFVIDKVRGLERGGHGQVLVCPSRIPGRYFWLDNGFPFSIKAIDEPAVDLGVSSATEAGLSQ